MENRSKHARMVMCFYATPSCWPSHFLCCPIMHLIRRSPRASVIDVPNPPERTALDLIPHDLQLEILLASWNNTNHTMVISLMWEKKKWFYCGIILFVSSRCSRENTICFWAAGLRLIDYWLLWSLAFISLWQKSPENHEMKTTFSDCALTQGFALQQQTHSRSVWMHRTWASTPSYVLMTLTFRSPMDDAAITASYISLSVVSLCWSSPGTPHFLLTLLPNLTSPMSLLDQPH